MRFSLNEIKEHTSINFVYDYSKEISSVIDILSIKPAKIHGEIYFSQNELRLDINVDVNLELACSKTLKPVPYEMHFDAEILFSDSLEADFPLTDPLELTDIIFGYIVSEKPYTIYHPDAKDIIFEEEKRPHPAFAELDKNMKK